MYRVPTGCTGADEMSADASVSNKPAVAGGGDDDAPPEPVEACEPPVEPSPLAKPLHVQRIEKALQLEPFLSYVEGILKHSQQR